MTTTDVTQPVRLVLTVEEAAERLGIGRTLMYALITSGRSSPCASDGSAVSPPTPGAVRHGPSAVAS